MEVERMVQDEPIADFRFRPIGVVRSSLTRREDAPRQGDEGAPDALLDIDPAFEPALAGVAPGDEMLVLTWFHLADREVLTVHPRNDPDRPLAGVFATRSPDRPNPIGLHRVTVREVARSRVRVDPLEAIDGTPIIDLKPVLLRLDDR
jgi:tRNA-Thr(GGU) m(6)t(6)A37 methyltransferase TsaA